MEEEGEEFGEEDSGVELGFGRDSPQLLSLPAPERDHVVSMLNHLTIPVFFTRRERSLARRIVEWSRDLVWDPVYRCLLLLLRDTV